MGSYEVDRSQFVRTHQDHHYYSYMKGILSAIIISYLNRNLNLYLTQYQSRKVLEKKTSGQNSIK